MSPPSSLHCCDDCTSSFRTYRTLQTHRNSCKIYASYAQKLQNLRNQKKDTSKTVGQSWRTAGSSRKWANPSHGTSQTCSTAGPSLPTKRPHAAQAAEPAAEPSPADKRTRVEEVQDPEAPGLEQYFNPPLSPDVDMLLMEMTTPAVPPIVIPPPMHHRRNPPRTARTLDQLPEALPSLLSDESDSSDHESESDADELSSVLRNAAAPPLPSLPRVRLIVRDHLATSTNSFGLWRKYLHRPTFDPDCFVPKEDLLVQPGRRADLSDLLASDDTLESDSDPGHLHANRSYGLLSEWQGSGSNTKSNAEVDRLVHEVLLHPDFRLDHIKKFRAQRVANEIDKQKETTTHLNGFTEASVGIEVPSGSKEIPPQTFQIRGLYYRSILSQIRAAFAGPLASKLHLSPYRLYLQKGAAAGEPSDQTASERVYCEVYDSDIFIEEHDKVQRSKNPPEDPHCSREKVIAALMLWSDSTHLTNFGMAKLWPIYMALGNLSKYIRSLPNSGAFQHLAYIPSLPDSLNDELAKWHTQWTKPSQRRDLLTHCRRELMHSVWRFLLDDEFVHAYTYGIVIKCVDGVERRVFPRLFTYSADYPEKYVNICIVMYERNSRVSL